MKKKPSAVAIVIAVIMSIILFIPIVGSGLVSGTVFSVGSLLQPGREEEIYQSFEANGGVDFIYDILITEMGEKMEFAEGISIKTEELLPQKDVADIVDGMYHAFLKGESYPVKLDNQKQFLKDKAMLYFDENAENKAREELGAVYDLADESMKAEAMKTARKEFEAEADAVIEEEISALEEELSTILDDIYASEEYKELKLMEGEYGYNLTDRQNLCEDIELAGNVFLGIGVALIVILLLCHLFRPAGFVTAGIFSLLTGGIMKVGAMLVPPALRTLLEAETLEGEAIPEFMIVMVEDVTIWCMDGFNKVGMMALGFGVVLFLIGILLFIIRRNNTIA